MATLSHITINRINVNDSCRLLESGGAEVSSLHREIVSGFTDFSFGSLHVSHVFLLCLAFLDSKLASLNWLLL